MCGHKRGGGEVRGGKETKNKRKTLGRDSTEGRDTLRDGGVTIWEWFGGADPEFLKNGKVKEKSRKTKKSI